MQNSMHHFGSNGIGANGMDYGGFDSESDFREIFSAELLMDPEKEGDELRHDLVMLNAALSRIDRKLDYSRIIEPLLVLLDVPGTAPPSLSLLARMRRQVASMRQELAQHQAAQPIPAGGRPHSIKYKAGDFHNLVIFSFRQAHCVPFTWTPRRLDFLRDNLWRCVAAASTNESCTGGTVLCNGMNGRR